MVKRNDFHYDGKGSGHDKDHCGGGGVNSYMIYHIHITVSTKKRVHTQCSSHIIGIIGKTLINYILIAYKYHFPNPDISGK